MLVRAEELNQLLNSKLYTARFVEARLGQRISTLETLLRVRTREADANFREMELLTAQVRGLQLEIKALNDVQYHGAISPGLVSNAGQSAQSLQQPSSLARARVIYAAGSESGSGLGVTPTMGQSAPISNETFVLARRLLLKQSMHPGFWGGGYVGLWLVPSVRH
ncbi:hypothetical protein FRC12_004795 [Ceratobasidium sp. 428]|nr:hypothetical protein FRC12_004795 [Ceratobasidium sp. 428]